MRTTNFPGWVGLLAGAGAAGVAAGIGYKTQLVNLMDIHPGAAGWAQAVGSFVALAIAIAVPEWQRSKARSDAEREKRLAGVSLMFMAAERVALVAHILQDPDGLETAISFAPGALRAAETAVTSFPAHTVGEPQGIVQLSHVSGLLVMSISIAETLEKEWSEKQDGEGRDAALAHALATMRTIAEQLDTKATVLAEGYGFAAEIAPIRRSLKADPEGTSLAA